MDPVSHAALGAGCAEAPAYAQRLRIAATLGGLAALAPDLDTLITSANDPLLVLEYHRQFTHALVFAPLGALACALLLHGWARRWLIFRHTYRCCLLGYASHGLLDACTSYGTELLWPFSDARIAWSIIPVIDPLLTLPAVALVGVSLYARRARYARIAVGWALAYLAFATMQHWRAESAGLEIARQRGHTPSRLEAKPALGGVLLWKTIYEYDGRYYVDAVRTGLSPTIFPGTSTAKLELRRDFPWLDPASRQAEDIERFRRVSDDFIAVDAAVPDRVVDMRYSMVPNEIAGFWAIVVDPDRPADQHVGFVVTREWAPDQAVRLLDMLF
jgi:inner membrane protein